MNEYDFATAYSKVDGTIRAEVKGVMDMLLENCHSIDVMEQVIREVEGIVTNLKEWSSEE